MGAAPASPIQHILLTNDDGIGSPLLASLVRAVRGGGYRVSVVAPDGERSWIGGAISREGTMTLVETQIGDQAAWSLSGTPSDCVNLALGEILKNDPPDLVISGPNIGFNTGRLMTLKSGTVGAAMEGAFWGIRAIALSQVLPAEKFAELRDGQVSDAETAQRIEQSVGRGLEVALEIAATAHIGQVHSLNLPWFTGPGTAARRVRLADTSASSLFRSGDGKHWSFGADFHRRQKVTFPPDTDRGATEAGEISHVVLDAHGFDLPPA